MNTKNNKKQITETYDVVLMSVGRKPNTEGLNLEAIGVKINEKKSIEIKASVVSKDEKENGLRAILNFGHTFGHALETIGSNKLYAHGEAVALGMLAATKLSESSLDLDCKVFDRVHSIIKNTGIKVNLKKK